MLRQIICIDEDKCVGCGLCTKACQEGAIALVDGKARLVRDDYCDGLGNCLPVCPTGAISFEEREGLAYDEKAVLARKKMEEGPAAEKKPVPLTRMQTTGLQVKEASSLKQWPIKIQLAPVQAKFYEGAKLLIAADCSAFVYPDFHKDFSQGSVLLVGCPKLEEGDFGKKLTAIIKENAIKEVHLLRMEVNCCGGLERALYRAMEDSKKIIPWHITTLTSAGVIKK
ncbi:MAG TPA: 4Fe-4S binding protein [Clostridia bacterium]|nr:4Fe-4S binding protein [Clostridia bacterium]